MKISIFTSYTNPEERMDPWKESLKCYEDFADEVVVVGKKWKYEFSFDQIGKVFQEGFTKSSGDWVIKMDIDTIFHENDFERIKYYLEKYKNFPGICLVKNQIFTPDRFHTKSRMCFILNKKKFPNIMLNGGGDLCDPTLNNQLLNEKNVPSINVPFWNYDSVFKSKDVIAEDRARFARAWNRHFGDYGNRGGGDIDAAYEAWFNMIKDRYKKHIYKLSPEDHPIYFQKKLKNLQKNQFGYNAFGLQDTLNRSVNDYYSAIRERYYSQFKLKLTNAKRNNFIDTDLQQG